MSTTVPSSVRIPARLMALLKRYTLRILPAAPALALPSGSGRAVVGERGADQQVRGAGLIDGQTGIVGHSLAASRRISKRRTYRRCDLAHRDDDFDTPLAPRP